MGLLTTLFSKRAHPNSVSGWSSILGIGPSTHAGVTVTEESALSLSAVFACIRVLAEGVASLPLITYRRRADRGKDRATDHPLYEVLHKLPNPEMTAIDFWGTFISHVPAWGNAYAEIEWSNSGTVLALWPLRPDKMRVKREGGRLRYEYTLPNGKQETLPEYRILHIRGLGGNGISGYSVVKLAMQGIGLGLGAEEYGARFYGNGARASFVLRHPGVLGDKSYDRLKESWEEEHQGLSNAHRMAILEEGMDIATIGIPPEEAQFLETRKFQVTDVARWFGVPPHKVGDLEHATFSNIEHLGLDFVVNTLRPWLVRVEQGIYRDLLSESERKQYFAEFLVDSLLRGDTNSRFQAYALGRQWGWYSANDILELENRNPIPGGDSYLVPLNMIPSGEERNDIAPDALALMQTDARRRIAGPERRAVEDIASDRRQLASSFLRILEDVWGRIVRREVNDVRRAVQKFLVKGNDLAGFMLWLDEFYNEHPDFIQKNTQATYETLGDQVHASVGAELDSDDDELAAAIDELMAFIASYVETLGVRMSASSAGQIRKIVRDANADNDDPAPRIEERLDDWEEKNAAKIARRESFRATNAFVWAAFGALGVQFLRWVASGDNCPYCDDLNGKVAGIAQAFLEAGEFQPDGADGPLKIRNTVRHPPVHDGCDCMIVAG